MVSIKLRLTDVDVRSLCCAYSLHVLNFSDCVHSVLFVSCH